MAPVILDRCIRELQDRKTGTKYHIKENSFYLDAPTMVRLWRGLSLRSEVDQSDSAFMKECITRLIDEERVYCENYGRVEVTETIKGAYRGITIRKLKLINWRGDKWEYQTRKNGTTSPKGE